MAGTGRALRVAVAMSGGVDSSVVAWLLARAGHEVLGVHMRNWDGRDEHGICPSDSDWEDVQRVCDQLPGGPHPAPLQLEFVQEYWNDVFTPFIEGFSEGVTPNPDVACNREIKFGALRQRVTSLEVDCLATGHYARLAPALAPGRGPAALDSLPSSSLEPVRQIAGAPEVWDPLRTGSQRIVTAFDRNKDQSYFLCQVPAPAFASVLFPLGTMLKSRVKALAAEAGLATAEKKESMGICFIGKRRFRDFLGQYIDPTPGHFETLDGQVLGPHDGFETYTVGQGARVGGQRVKWFVVDKRDSDRAVILAPGTNHPALLTTSLTAFAKDFCWSSGSPPSPLETALGAEDPLSPIDREGSTGPHAQGSLRCFCCIRYRQSLAPCTDPTTLALRNDSSLIFSFIGTVKILRGKGGEEDRLQVTFDDPVRAVAPGQITALYLPCDPVESEVLPKAVASLDLDRHAAQHPGPREAQGHGAWMCIGGGPVARRGPSFAELGLSLPPGFVT